tara:strand:+ start:322 stop:651 length:330 start_codon:yes stop_codon:yes gene_type:complete
MPKAEKQRIYLEVPFREKERAKRFGARWDPDKKRWYVRGDRVPSQLEKFISIKEYLAEPYEPDYLSRYSYFGFETGLSMSVMCHNYYGFELMPKTNRGRVFIDGGSTVK